MGAGSLATALNKVRNSDHPFQVMIDAIPYGVVESSR